MPDSLKILFFSDTHLGFDYPVNPRTMKRRRGVDFFNSFETILDIAVKEKFNLVIHGGDLFFRSKIPLFIIDKVYMRLLKFSSNGIPIVLLPGNHERSNLPESILIAAPNIHFITEPMRVTLSINERSIAITGFPFYKGILGPNSLKFFLKSIWIKEVI